MLEIQLLDLFQVYLPAIIFAMICCVSFLHFLKTKGKGYLVISIGFVLLTIGWLVLPLVKNYLILMATDVLPYSGLNWIPLYVTYIVFYIVAALLILIGFLYIYKEGNVK